MSNEKRCETCGADPDFHFRCHCATVREASMIGLGVRNAAKRIEDAVGQFLEPGSQAPMEPDAVKRALAGALAMRWRALTDEQRLELSASCCRGCGSLDPRCQCWNDE